LNADGFPLLSLSGNFFFVMFDNSQNVTITGEAQVTNVGGDAITYYAPVTNYSASVTNHNAPAINHNAPVINHNAPQRPSLTIMPQSPTIQFRVLGH